MNFFQAFVDFFAKITNNTAFYPFTQDSPMYLHNALYYSLVTMTTLGFFYKKVYLIGFGDIYPHGFTGRVVMTSFIMIVALLYSAFFSELTVLMQ